MLKKIRLTDFKSFVDEEVELAPLTLLVGANASGKSNFLDALRFLYGLSRDLTIPEVLNGEEGGGPDRWPGLRGRTEESTRVGRSLFEIETVWENLAKVRDKRIKHHIVYTTATAHTDEWVEYAGDRFYPHPDLDLQKSMISPSGFSLSDGADRFQVLVALSFAIESIRSLDMKPSVMRGYGRRSAPLGNEGKNFSGVLARLCETPLDKQSLVDWLREVCAPEIEDLDFAEIKELGDVMAIFLEKGGARISTRSISDGTLRFLGTLLALRTAKPGELLLIEEIEEGLHPTRIQFLIELLESAVRQSGIQVIATTHSPTVLQWLSPGTLRNVIVFGRVPDHEGTLMRRLGDLPHFDEVVQRKGIEELFSTGWLEMAL